MDRYAILTDELRRRCPGMELRENESMSRYTTFRVGGPARLMALPRSAQEAGAVVRAAREMDITPFYLGNGSNLLVSDAGYEGLVIRTVGALDRLEVRGETIIAGSGVLLSVLSRRAWEQGLAGLEFAAGIPGSLGGAVTMNAGAYGGEMCQVVRRVAFLDQAGEPGEMEGETLDFSYRHSAFSGGERLILGAELSLVPGDREAMAERMAELGEARRSKQPLEYPSAGSTFKRPAGQFAAALIDQCGLKGMGVGGAQVSEKHAGFLINRGGATCADILKLAELVRSRVLRETGVELELEIKTLGPCALEE